MRIVHVSPKRRAPNRDRSAGLLAKIKVKGLRLTGPRRIVAELLASASNHLDAETVVVLARRRDPGIHRATVYRILKAFKRAGLIDELDLMHVEGERHYYEVRPGDFHIHLVCTCCRGVEEPSGSFWESIRRRVERQTGFHPEVIRIEMGGVCRRCRSRRGSRCGPTSGPQARP